jgi:hypothetical protein
MPQTPSIMWQTAETNETQLWLCKATEGKQQLKL